MTRTYHALFQRPLSQGIRLGPSLPAFVSPTVLNVLVENFDIKPITEPGADVAAMMQGK